MVVKATLNAEAFIVYHPLRTYLILVGFSALFEYRKLKHVDTITCTYTSMTTEVRSLTVGEILVSFLVFKNNSSILKWNVCNLANDIRFARDVGEHNR